jgi:hypothetical protein
VGVGAALLPPEVDEKADLLRLLLRLQQFALQKKARLTRDR